MFSYYGNKLICIDGLFLNFFHQKIDINIHVDLDIDSFTHNAINP